MNTEHIVQDIFFLKISLTDGSLMSTKRLIVILRNPRLHSISSYLVTENCPDFNHFFLNSKSQIWGFSHFFPWLYSTPSPRCSPIVKQAFQQMEKIFFKGSAVVVYTEHP